MLNRTYWIVPGQIIGHELSGEVSLNDVKGLVDGMRALLETDQQSLYVDAIMDISQVTSYQSDATSIKKLFTVIKKHERVRWNIFVNPTPNPVLHFIVRMVCQLFKTRIRIVSTRDEALDFIQTVAFKEAIR